MRRYPLNSKALLEKLEKSSLTEETMKMWDGLRAYLLGGGTGSLGRDIFESIIDSIDEERAEAAARIKELEKERDNLLFVSSLSPLKYGPAVGDTLADMKENVRKTELFNSGDLSLVWVNTGDLVVHSMAAAKAVEYGDPSLRYDAAGSVLLNDKGSDDVAE